jgi:hypothetical protein
MLKKITVVIALLGVAALGGCAGLTPANLASDIATYEQEVQADTNLVCGFIPTVSTIVQLIPGAGTIAPAAASVAEAICAAVAKAPVPTTQSARLKSLASPGVVMNVAKVVVPGVGPVSISGTFTR